MKIASPSYQIFMLALCLLALGVFVAEAAVHLEPETKDVLDRVDALICGIFLIDFFVSFARAPNRAAYMLKWGWLDLCSSIPMFDFARWGRVARILRAFRILRGLRAARLLATVIVRRRAENALLAASLLALLLLTFCSIAILHFETTPEANITTGDDALWWAFATITTVGYGDHYPVTTEGRFIAAILMCAGVGLFGVFSGFLASWFVGSEGDSADAELASIRAELAALRQLLTERKSGTSDEERTRSA